MTIIDHGRLLVLPDIIGTIKMDSEFLSRLGAVDGECLALVLNDARILLFQQLVKEDFLVLMSYEVVDFWKCCTWCGVVFIRRTPHEYTCGAD